MTILTARQGSNADLLRDVFLLYVPDGVVVADVTYGRGVFWKYIDRSKYHVLQSDIQEGIDLRALPYAAASVDVLILDPPYMHGGKTVKSSINKCYKNENGSHESVMRLYTGGILEAARVLKRRGKIIIKTQDEIESGRQRLSHIEIAQLLEILGFRVIDLLLLVQRTVPTMREQYQKSARKNHSYAIVAEFRR